MKENIKISGFADEISQDFETQLKTVTELGMHYISLRSADGKNVADYTAAEAEEKLLPRLKARLGGRPAVELLCYAGCLALAIFCFASLASGGFAPFIYSQF